MRWRGSKSAALGGDVQLFADELDDGAAQLVPDERLKRLPGRRGHAPESTTPAAQPLRRPGRMNSGPDTGVGATSLRLCSVRVGRKRCSVRVAEEARIRHMRIDETKLELLPVRLRSSTHGTVYLVIQSREGAPRLSLILINVLAASSDLTGQSRAGT